MSDYPISALLGVFLVAGVGSPGVAIAQKSDATASESEKTTGPMAKELIEKLERSKKSEERKQLIDKLIALKPVPRNFFAEYLKRTRKSSDSHRRSVLTKIGAEVPDAKGRFRSRRKRKSDKLNKSETDAFDWLSELVEGPGTSAARSPGYSEVVSDVAIIRALASGTDWRDAKVFIDFAFTQEGIIYRDEVGRRARDMAPLSIPALVRATKGAKDKSRYCNYQLERLDRQNPDKAFANMPTAELKIELLNAYSASQYREAVYVVLANVDHVNPQVRKASRNAWLEFATGKPPKEAPKKKLLMTGGRTTEDEMPLWLNHRELADVAIRKLLEEKTGDKPKRRAKLKSMTEGLFAHFDNARTSQRREVFNAANQAASEGKLAEATAMVDRVLVEDPEFPERAKFSSHYFAHAQALEKQSKWTEASIAFAKAHALDPKGTLAEEALSLHHRARGKAFEGSGGDSKKAEAAFQRAQEIDKNIAAGADGGKKSWLLPAGIGGSCAGVLMLLLGLALRRRSA